MRRYEKACWPALFAGLLLSGCLGGGAGEENRVPVYEVTGTVTYNGAPVADAAVTFSPQEEQPVAVGRTNADGAYTLTTYEPGDGAAAGDYVVLITKMAVAASDVEIGPDDPNYGQPTQHAADQPAGQEEAVQMLPERYSRIGQSDLTATVQPDGENVFNFDLEP